MEARRFCRQHGVAREDARLIEFLVREHLTMSNVAQKQDLSDPDVITAFAQRVGNERYLTALYLLTVADIRGTSPRCGTPGRASCSKICTAPPARAGRAGARCRALIEARKREALGAGPERPALRGAQEALGHAGRGLLHAPRGRRHRLAHPPPRATWARSSPWCVHASHWLGEGPAGAGVRRRPERPVCTHLRLLRPGGFSILDARVHTASNGYALDTFQVVSASMQGHYRELTHMVENDLAQSHRAGRPLPEPGRKRVSRRVKSFPSPPRHAAARRKAQRWLLGISASDRTGLLYLVARVLARHQLSVQLAKVSTLGERWKTPFWCRAMNCRTIFGRSRSRRSCCTRCRSEGWGGRGGSLQTSRGTGAPRRLRQQLQTQLFQKPLCLALAAAMASRYPPAHPA